MIPVLGIPYVNRPDLLVRCVESIDCEVGQLVIIDQLVEPLDAATLARLLDGNVPAAQIHVARHVNNGCAGAWNEIIRHPADWWLLVNNDIEFAPGELRRMAEFLNAECEMRNAESRRPLAAAYGNHGASWWAVTAHGAKTVGTFDENFFPAYLEDCDWSTRCDRLGERRENVPGSGDFKTRHGDGPQTGSCTANANAAMRRWVAYCHEQGFRYYAAKWGGRNEHETFATPFNDPGWPLWAWRFDTVWRRHLWAGWNEEGRKQGSTPPTTDH
jgi:GT2 family glycosyltransferase